MTQRTTEKRHAFSYVAYHKASCRECQAEFEAKSASAEFCSGKCRNDYNNRRAVRGMILFDLFMEMRYRRAGAKGLWSIMCRLAEEWREEDKAKRERFQSWKDPRDYIEKRPYLKAKKGRI